MGEAELFLSYYICARAAKREGKGLPQWPREKCGDCDCSRIKVRQGTLGDEHKIDWSLPENGQ